MATATRVEQDRVCVSGGIVPRVVRVFILTEVDGLEVSRVQESPTVVEQDDTRQWSTPLDRIELDLSISEAYAIRSALAHPNNSNSKAKGLVAELTRALNSIGTSSPKATPAASNKDTMAYNDPSYSGNAFPRPNG